MGKLIEQEELQPVVKSLKGDLRNLSRVCLKALNKLGAEQHTDEDVVAAVQLSNQYTTSIERGRQIDCKATRIRELWRNEGSSSVPSVETNSEDRATHIVGKSLVEVITEKNKQPPDVSIST